MKRWLFLAATSLILAGCTPWPEHGQGGFAEDYPPQLAACAEGDNLRTLETYLDRLRTSKIRLDVLMLEGASVWFPGLVHVSRDQAARTTRVLFACRVKDTEADLAVLNNQLDDLEKRLNAVISYGICCGIPDGSDNLNVPEASIVTDDLPADFVSGARLATDSSAIAEARDLLDITALFDFDKSEVRTEARQQIFKAGEILSRLPDVMITVYGHTDSKGSDEYNQGLSERRAWAVRELLVESGMSPTHVSIVAAGEKQPIDTNLTDDGRQANRRVEFDFGKIGDCDGCDDDGNGDGNGNNRVEVDLHLTQDSESEVRLIPDVRCKIPYKPAQFWHRPGSRNR